MENIFTSNTLYYFFSTVAQVSAAVSALLGVFVLFKINEIKSFLLGDGLSIYDGLKRTGAFSEDKRIMINRLNDANVRRDLYNIERILKTLSDQEEIEDTKHVNKKGYVALHERFKLMNDDRKMLITYVKMSTYFSISTILTSLFSLVFVDLIIKSCELKIASVITVFVLMAASIYYFIKGINQGLDEKQYEYEKQGY